MLPDLAIAMSLICCMNLASAVVVEPAVKPSRLVATATGGRSFSLEDARGRMSLLIYWSPDSLASRKSMYELQRFTAAAQSRDIFLLAVSTSLDRKKVQAFMTERKLSFPYALRGEDDLGALDERSLPMVLVFDAEGRLLRQHTGMFHLKILHQLIDPEAVTQVR